jgi:hypothetical protein
MTTFPPLDILKSVGDGIWLVDSGLLHAGGVIPFTGADGRYLTCFSWCFLQMHRVVMLVRKHRKLSFVSPKPVAGEACLTRR